MGCFLRSCAKTHYVAPYLKLQKEKKIAEKEISSQAGRMAAYHFGMSFAYHLHILPSHLSPVSRRSASLVQELMLVKQAEEESSRATKEDAFSGCVCKNVSVFTR